MKSTTATFGKPIQETKLILTRPYPWLQLLCGWECGFTGENNGPANTRGLFVLETVERSFSPEDFLLLDYENSADHLKMTIGVGDTDLLIISEWQWDGAHGIWSRQDCLKNKGGSAQVITRFLARFTFSPAEYTHYTQSASWCHENQGHFQRFYSGRFALHSQGGRTTGFSSPYLFSSSVDHPNSLAFHLLPLGDWTIQVDQGRTPKEESAPFLVVEMGLSEQFLRNPLPPGGILKAPEILIQAVEGNDPKNGAVALQGLILQRFANRTGWISAKQSPPVIYNTWFDVYDSLQPDRLRLQLQAAKKAGCEIFVVDAGWFGNGRGDWYNQVGDWQEKMDAAFRGKMHGFSEEVRAAGLGFGLWVEPERISAFSPVAQAHPAWFQRGDGGFLFPDLDQEGGRAFVLSTLKELIETYQLAWIKIDFNFELRGASDAFQSYYKNWYGILDEIRNSFPHVFIEGCASGGMRLDLNTLAHFDAHFLTDTVSPLDVLRITQGAALRLPLARLTKWAVMRGMQNQVVQYGVPAEQAPERILTPSRGDWEAARIAELDFVFLAALPGIPGFSGDLASLSEKQLSRLNHWSGFYKEWRTFLADSVCEPLTQIRLQSDRTGWLAFHLRVPHRDESFLLVYRLQDGNSKKRMTIPHLNPEIRYQVFDGNDLAQPLNTLDGEELASQKLEIVLPAEFSAGIYLLKPEPKWK